MTNDRPNIQERYAKASEAHSLVLREGLGPVDVLMAAGMASQGSKDRMVALTIWRMRDGSRAQFPQVVEALSGWLRRETQALRLRELGRKQYKALSSRVLFWHLNPICHYCLGRGHPVIAETPVLDDTRICPECHGTGITPLERLLQPDTVTHGRVLADHIDRISASVFGEMRRKLR